MCLHQFCCQSSAHAWDHHGNWCYYCSWWCHHYNWWCRKHSCIDLEGKLICCNKVACFYDNKFSTSITHNYISVTHENIDATTTTQQQQKNMLLVKVFYQKIISLKQVLGYNPAKWQATEIFKQVKCMVIHRIMLSPGTRIQYKSLENPHKSYIFSQVNSRGCSSDLHWFAQLSCIISELFADHWEPLKNHFRMVCKSPRIALESFQNCLRITKNHLTIISEWFTNHQESLQNGSWITENHQELLENYFRMLCKSPRIIAEWFVNYQESFQNGTENCSRIISECFANHSRIISEWFVNHRESLENHLVWFSPGMKWWSSAFEPRTDGCITGHYLRQLHLAFRTFTSESGLKIGSEYSLLGPRTCGTQLRLQGASAGD